MLLAYVVPMQTLIAALYVLGFVLTASGALSAVTAVRRAYGVDPDGRRNRYLTWDNVDDVMDAVSARGWLYLSLILGGGLVSTIASVMSVL